MAECPEDDCRKKMAQDVPCSDRGGTFAVEDTTLGCIDGNGAEAPLVVGDFRAHRALDGICGVSVAIVVGNVDAAVRLRGGPSVVGDHAVSCHGDSELNYYGFVETINFYLVTIGSIRNSPNGLPHGVFATFDDGRR